jgi:pyrroline-5-carboxylate reductase
MGRTLLQGLLQSGTLSRQQAWASAKTQATCDKVAAELDVAVEVDYKHRIPASDVVLLCVKPNQAAKVLAGLHDAGLRQDTLMISIMAGTTIPQLEASLGTENPWVRAMPNTPCIVGEGMTVICSGQFAGADHLARAQRVFGLVGQCIPVDETYFNAITALSASGPAYQYLIMEALADAGVRVGLPRQLALTLVAQTVLGSARMVLATGRHPAALRDDVTTPAGCTIGGLLMLEDGKIRSVLARAVEEATKIASHLGPPAAPSKPH